MAEELAPTYREELEGEVTRYTCLIPDAGHEDGICGHWSADRTLFEQHMAQRHGGVMLAAPPVSPPVTDAPAAAPSGRRTAPPAAEKAEPPPA
jgi:hypothetical protein